MLHELPKNALEMELMAQRVDPVIAGKWARIYADLHPKQQQALDDPSRRQAWEKGRRGGGSYAAAAKLLKNYHQWGGHTSLFGALTKEHARRIIWPTLEHFNTKYELGGKPNSGTEMSWKFPTGDGAPYTILVCAMKDRAQIEKLRGIAGGLRSAVIDEAGSFVPYDSQFRNLIGSVIAPQFMDTFHLGGGDLTLLGSPALDPRGFFYEKVKGRTHNGKPIKRWSRHYWTALHNTHLDAAEYLLSELTEGEHVIGDASPEELVRAMVALKDCELDDPRWGQILSQLSVTFRREYLAEWVTDSDSLIYVPTAANMLEDGHVLDESQPWRIVIGCDVGWGDGNGFCVAAKSLRGREIILCEAYYLPEMTDEEIAKELLALQRRYRTGETYVDDVGHADRLIANMAHFGIHVQAAARGRKKPRIEYPRTLIRNGSLKIRADRCAHLLSEMASLPWDEDRQTHRENFYDDVIDAMLAAVGGLGQLFLPGKPKRPKRGEPGWEAEEARREREIANRAGRRIHRAGRRARFRSAA